MFDRIVQFWADKVAENKKSGERTGSSSRFSTDPKPAAPVSRTGSRQAPAGRDVLMDKQWVSGGRVQNAPVRTQLPANRASVPESRGGPALVRYASPEVQVVDAAERVNRDNALAARDYDNQISGRGTQQLPTEVVAMDWSEYQALNPRQRAAVDLNSELVQAVNADKADTAAKLTPEYTELTEKLFGEGRGSETVAPRTVALLSELNSGRAMDTPADLDQFLRLDSLVSSDDLRFLADDQVDATRQSLLGGVKEGPDGTVTDRDRYQRVDARAENTLRLADRAQAKLAESLAAGQSLIGKLQVDSDLGARLFGEPTTALGFNPANERDTALQSIFDAMARTDTDFSDTELQEALGSFEQEFGLSNEQLLTFFETRLKAAEYGNTPIGFEPEGQYLNPAEFRARYYGGSQ